jgi:transcription elongation factor GreA
MSTIPITKRGAEKLKDELHRLKTVDRPGVIQAIAEARAQGDLSENAEYDAAKDRQGFIEGRIQEIEGKLSAAQIIDPMHRWMRVAAWCLVPPSNWKMRARVKR